MAKKYKYNIGDKIICKDNSYNLILGKTINKRNRPAYECQCRKGHTYIKSQDKITSRCPYCTKQLVATGVNDIATTDPEMFSMLVDKEYGYTHHDTSNEETEFKCPTCGKILKRTPNYIKNKGFRCPSCAGGISYGERFIANMLDTINVKFIYQFSAKDANWCGKYRYDFYIPSVDCIIEVMGLQHYQTTSWADYEDIHKNDIAKKELGLQHVKHYVELDVRSSTLNYIKQAILRSSLDDLLWLWHYDHYFSWKEIHKKAMTPILNLIIEKYNSGITEPKEIGKFVNLNKGTVVRYLNDAKELGLCNYDPEKRKQDTLAKNHEGNSERTSRPIVCIDDGKIFRNGKLLECLSVELYNKFMNKKNISATCHGRQKTCKGKHLKFISRVEFNNIKETNPENAYGDAFELLEDVA